MKYDLPPEISVVADGPVRKARRLAARLAAQPPEALGGAKRIVNMYLSQILGGPMQAGFAAEVVTMQTEDHRQRLLAVRERSQNR